MVAVGRIVAATYFITFRAEFERAMFWLQLGLFAARLDLSAQE